MNYSNHDDEEVVFIVQKQSPKPRLKLEVDDNSNWEPSEETGDDSQTTETNTREEKDVLSSSYENQSDSGATDISDHCDPSGCRECYKFCRPDGGHLNFEDFKLHATQSHPLNSWLVEWVYVI